MAKKNTWNFVATVTLNPEKGGGWLAKYDLRSDDEFLYGSSGITAWKTSSAAKRWVKAKVQELTPRKSVKMFAETAEDSSKPVAFAGSIQYKA